MPKTKPLGFNVKVNGQHRARAMLTRPGVLVVTFAVERPAHGKPRADVRVEGTTTIGADGRDDFARWIRVDLQASDTVEIAVVNSGRSVPRPKVLIAEGRSTRAGRLERLAVLKRELEDLQRELAPRRRKRS